MEEVTLNKPECSALLYLIRSERSRAAPLSNRETFSRVPLHSKGGGAEPSIHHAPALYQMLFYLSDASPQPLLPLRPHLKHGHNTTALGQNKTAHYFVTLYAFL